MIRHDTNSSATSMLVQSEGATLIRVRPRVPMRAPSIPPELLRPWERLVLLALLLAAISIWLAR